MRLYPVGLVATLALAILVAPLAANAQPPGKVFRVGVLLPASLGPSSVFRVFKQRLQELGYVEGQNLALEVRAARGATDTIPIVMIARDYDPIALGYVASLARPGGNITGVFQQRLEVTAKKLELLKAALPMKA